MKLLMLGKEPNKCLLFKSMGWDVIMLISGFADGLLQRPIIEDDEYQTIKSNTKAYSYLSILKRSREIRKLVKQFGRDTVFINTKKDMLATKLAFLGKKNGPLVIGAFCNSYSWNNDCKVKLLLPLLKRCFDGYISMARFAYDKLLSYGFPKEKQLYLQNYVDHRNFRQKQSYMITKPSLNFIYVGVITKGKNQRFFIDVALSLIKKNFNPTFSLCGDLVDKKEEQYIRGKIKEYHLEKNIILLGRVENTEVRKLLLLNDFYISASISEMSPNNILEAKASAMPIICSKVVGQIDLIEQDKTGCLYEYNNVGECVNQILKLVDNESLRKRLGQNAYLDVSQINSYEVGALKLEKFIANLNQKKSDGNSIK